MLQIIQKAIAVTIAVAIQELIKKLLFSQK
jgi:hypothetical protein